MTSCVARSTGKLRRLRLVFENLVEGLAEESVHQLEVLGGLGGAGGAAGAEWAEQRHPLPLAVAERAAVEGVLLGRRADGVVAGRPAQVLVGQHGVLVLVAVADASPPPVRDPVRGQGRGGAGVLHGARGGRGRAALALLGEGPGNEDARRAAGHGGQQQGGGVPRPRAAPRAAVALVAVPQDPLHEQAAGGGGSAAPRTAARLQATRAAPSRRPRPGMAAAGQVAVAGHAGDLGAGDGAR